jgi:hypothetical protein
MRSTPAAAAVAAALRMTSGSAPNSCSEIGCSSGCTRSISRVVRSLPWCTPKLETISETTSPAPKRRACKRTNQLPMPASGASATRLGIAMPCRVQGSVSMGSAGVALVQQA